MRSIVSQLTQNYRINDLLIPQSIEVLKAKVIASAVVDSHPKTRLTPTVVAH